MIIFFTQKPEAIACLLENFNTFPAYDLIKRILLLNLEESNSQFIVFFYYFIKKMK